MLRSRHSRTLGYKGGVRLPISPLQKEQGMGEMPMSQINARFETKTIEKGDEISQFMMDQCTFLCGNTWSELSTGVLNLVKQ